MAYQNNSNNLNLTIKILASRLCHDSQCDIVDGRTSKKGEYVGGDDAVRAYDVFVEALNLEELGIEVEEDEVGNSAYDPKVMLKILAYGYSDGWRSSRKLERALHHNLSFIWLTGDEA